MRNVLTNKCFKYLPTEVYHKLVDAMDHGAALDREAAARLHVGMGQHFKLQEL